MLMFTSSMHRPDANALTGQGNNDMEGTMLPETSIYRRNKGGVVKGRDQQREHLSALRAVLSSA